MSEQRFYNFKDANKFASKLAKAKQSPMVKRDQGEWIVVIPNDVEIDSSKTIIKPIALNYQCKSEVPKIINQAGTSRQSDAAKPELVNLAVPPTIQIARKLSIIEEMNIKDFSILVANNFRNCDIAMLAKMKNRLIEIGADSDVMESIKLAIERSKPRGQWTMDVDGIGGSRDAIKRMKGQDFNDMRKRGR